jgi:hypothetical protein
VFVSCAVADLNMGFSRQELDGSWSVLATATAGATPSFYDLHPLTGTGRYKVCDLSGCTEYAFDLTCSGSGSGSGGSSGGGVRHCPKGFVPCDDGCAPAGECF